MYIYIYHHRDKPYIYHPIYCYYQYIDTSMVCGLLIISCHWKIWGDSTVFALRPVNWKKKLIVSKNHLCFIIVYHVFIMVNDVFNKCSSTVHHVSSLVHQFSSCLHIGSSVFINCWSMFIMFNHHFHDPLVLTHAPFRVKRQRRGHWQRQRLGCNCALRRRASEGSGATPGM